MTSVQPSAGLVVDLNADLGESFGAWRLGDDEALMGIITSANLACGFHAGDPLTLRRGCVMAAAAGVTIGAQVSYRDLAGFGRRAMDVPADELAAELLYQVAALDGIACRGLKPDLTLLVDVDPEASLARARARNAAAPHCETRLDDESLDFHRRVWDAYHALARSEPQRVKLVNGRTGLDSIEKEVWDIVSAYV